MSAPVQMGSAVFPEAQATRRVGFQASPTTILAACAVAGVVYFCIAFLVVPNVAVLGEIINPDKGTFAETVSDLWQSERVRRGVVNSFIVAVLSVITVNVVGCAQAFLLDGLAIKGRNLLIACYALPLVFGGVSAVTGYSMVYGREGILTSFLQSIFPALPDNWFTGMWAVLFVHTFTMTGYHFLFLRPALRRVDFSVVEAAQSLGVSPLVAFVKVVIPALRPTIIAATLLVFIGGASSMAAPMILGGSDFTMLTPIVQALSGAGRYDMAAVLGLSLAVITGGILVWAVRSEMKHQAHSGSKYSKPFQRLQLKNGPLNVGAHVVAYFLALMNLLPLLMTIVMSFTPNVQIRRGEVGTAFTFEHFQSVFTDSSVGQPLINSLIMCAIAVPAAIVIGTFVVILSHRYPGAFTGTLQGFLYMPYFLPGILIALGLLIAYGEPHVLIGFNVLVGSYWILPIAYVITQLPTILRFVGASLAGVDPSYDEAGRSLGAGPLYRLARITLPMLLPVIFQVAAIGFNGVFDDYVLAVMLYNLNNRPLGVTLATMAMTLDPEIIGVATAFVVINTVLTLMVILLADRMAERASRFQSKEG
ncbi:iron ABC transporter permease [Corynebacterium sp.]|uniref:ABC transporter permease n=1 Tax=Corynebacterium sp. TaxID=1720 RepID=UPI0026E0BE92|nr:iron ABC transporter permease [Corynebacterium sp.]MDO5512859.1 iron ABC transporter permease [Corynebacterium sp.]